MESGIYSAVALSMVPGGRVELPTPAFSGPRSTGELPRHLCSQKIVRALSKRVNVLLEDGGWMLEAGFKKIAASDAAGSARLQLPASNL